VVTNLTLIVLIMDVKSFAPFDNSLVDRMPDTPFNLHRNSLLHPIAHHFTEQDFSLLLCHNLRPFRPYLWPGLELTLSLNCLHTRNITPHCCNATDILNLTDRQLKPQVKKFFDQLLSPLLQFVIGQFT
jgi:hypothetical protein